MRHATMNVVRNASAAIINPIIVSTSDGEPTRDIKPMKTNTATAKQTNNRIFILVFHTICNTFPLSYPPDNFPRNSLNTGKAPRTFSSPTSLTIPAITGAIPAIAASRAA